VSHHLLFHPYTPKLRHPDSAPTPEVFLDQMGRRLKLEQMVASLSQVVMALPRVTLNSRPRLGELREVGKA
jgi:hypothetical protein